jgi:hypothetical protein
VTTEADFYGARSTQIEKNVEFGAFGFENLNSQKENQIDQLALTEPPVVASESQLSEWFMLVMSQVYDILENDIMLILADTSGIKTLEKKKPDYSCYLRQIGVSILPTPKKLLTGFVFAFVRYAGKEDQVKLLNLGGTIRNESFHVCLNEFIY